MNVETSAGTCVSGCRTREHRSTCDSDECTGCLGAPGVCEANLHAVPC